MRPRVHRPFLPLCVVAAIPACGINQSASNSSSQPPNVLLFLVDTLRADALGPYGNDVVETPAIDRFAREGTLFEWAFAQTPWTRPSVTSILTGLHPTVHGVERRGSVLPPGVEFLPEVLREHGYRTGFLATNPNVGSFFGYSRGFDDFIELYERRESGAVNPRELIARSDQVVDRAKEWLEGSSKPFFLVVFVVDPHFPYDPPPDFNRYVDRTPPASSQVPEGDPRHGLYYGEVAFVDHCFGQLMEYLDERGLSERTISILTSDHGEEFFDHGQIGHGKALYDESLRVPLVLRWPGAIEAGRRIDSPVELVDLMPTLLELAQLPSPQIQDGRSLWEASEERAPFLGSLKLDGQRKWSARAYPWKLVVDRHSVMLFDLASDPGELRDVSDQYPEHVRELQAWLAEREESDQRRNLLVLQGVRPGEGPDEELSEDAQKALRELGYIQ